MEQTLGGKRKAPAELLKRKKMRDLEIAESQETESATVKCSITADPIAQKRRRIAAD